MKTDKIIYSALLQALLLVLAQSCLVANVVWPALYTEARMNSIPIISASLVLEYFVYKYLFQLNVKKALLYTLAANIASGLAGMVLRPVSGLGYEFTVGMLTERLFGWGTFNPVAWCFVPVIGGAINAALELLAIRLIWKNGITGRIFLIAWVINTVTVAMATVWVLYDPPRM